MRLTNLLFLKPIKLHITLIFLMVWGFVFCQQYTNYSLKDGLPSNHVYRITQDYDGFIWIITDRGISKFDGKTFKNFTIKDGLPSNDIWSIKITPDNKKWFFSRANKLGYILEDKVYSFPSNRDQILYPRYILQSGNEIAFNDGHFFYTLKDSIWKGKEVEIDTMNLIKQLVLHPYIKYQLLTTEGELSLATTKGKEMLSVNFNTTKRVTYHNQINDSLYMYASLNDYSFINLNTRTLHTISRASQNIKNDFRYLRAHQVNDEVQLTGLNFVSYLDDQFEMEKFQSIPKVFDSHFSFIDKIGNVWSATFNHGIYMLPKAKSDVSYLAQNKKIQQLKLIDTTLYAAVFKEGYFKISDQLNSVIKNSQFQYGISNIPELQSIFFSSRNALVVLKNNRLKPLDVTEYFNTVNSFARELLYWKGNLYGYNSFGISKINLQNFTIEKAYKSYATTSISKTKEELFIGNQQGLFKLKKDSIIKIISNPLFDFPVISQVPYYDNQVIIGTDGNGGYVTNSHNAYTIEGAKDLSVQDIFVQTATNFWLATNRGVHKVTRKDTSYAITRSYYEADGLLSNNTNSVVIKNDSLYVATDIGISVMSLQQEHINQLQELYVKSVLVNGDSQNDCSFSIPYAKDNYLSFNIAVIDYSNQANLKYSYRLSPINKGWVSTTSQEINFTNLKPQQYQLEFKATNHHNVSVYKTVDFNISPLWYQTLWFKILALFGFLLLMYLFFRWFRVRIQKKIITQERAKQKAIFHELHALRSQMNPHFVFNSLNAIQYYMNKNEIELSEKYLVKFSRLIRMFFDFSREQFISIEQDIKLLKAYLEIEKMRFGKDFKFKFIVDTKMNLDTKIPSMLLQPIVENAVNHGLFHQKGKGKVSIEIQKLNEEEGFTVCIKDNGVGFKRAKEIKAKSVKKHNSKATEIILDRIKLINNSSHWNIVQKITDLTSNGSTGTEVLLTFKQNKYD